MEPSCSHSKCDVYERSKISYENVIETDTNIRLEPPCNNVRQQIDDIEREDFEEENRMLKHCSSMIVDGEIATTARYSGNLSSANSSLASSSETISTLSNMMANDFSLPGCSKSDDCEGSNATIKNMIHSRTPLYSNIEPPPKKVDFMQKLLSSNTQEKKDFPKGKLYKGDLMENSGDADMYDVGGQSGRTSSNASSIGSSGSDSKDFTVPSTSNAEKLLGLDDSSKRNASGSSKSAVRMFLLFNHSFKYDNEKTSHCSCLQHYSITSSSFAIFFCNMFM